ncbi:unnamed protein product [Parnassius apollo]|uniref:(apollo) hypothetical protein n=1 Tax=Parnassius apollo TaxID=110799 RepID=A0A8S3WVI3_PARAO|nr:unnamed protein product [Parnassius apollo]
MGHPNTGFGTADDPLRSQIRKDNKVDENKNTKSISNETVKGTCKNKYRENKFTDLSDYITKCERSLDVTGGCFGIRNDDDEDEEFYTKRQSFELITTLSTNAMDNQNLTLTKNLDNAKTQQTNKITQKDFLGKCKPGGCLDPPFGEDKYSYIPKLIDISESKKDLSEVEKNKDQDETSLINIINVKAEGESGYNADYKKENIKSSCPADSNFINIKKSNSIITYPSTSSSTELFSTSDKIHKKIKKDRKSKDNGLSNLPNEFIETYYISPKKTKKTNNLEESNGNIVKFNKEEKSPKITLSHLHLDIQDAITCNHMAQSHVQNTSTRVDAIEEMQPILNVSKVKLDDQVKIGNDINKLSGKSLSQPDCGSNKNIKNIEAIICHEGNSNNLLNCTAVSAIAGDTVFRGSDSNICSIINDTPNNSYLTLLNKDTNDRNPLDYDTKQPLKDIKSLSMDKKHSINNNFRNMIEFQSTVLKTQDNHYECDRVKAATNELICIINKSQSKNTENNFKTKALVSLTTEAIESNLLPKSNSETENKNLDISDTKKITSVTTFISKQDKIERSKIENEISNDISPQPIMQDKIDSNIKDYKMSLNKLNTTDSKNSKDLLISPVTIDHKVDIEKQKEHISSECKSVHEKPIEKDTAHNNYFTSISYKEKLHNNIIPQTKLDGEVKSINESILCNNIDKGSLTSLKETALITDNIQNISAQDHKVDIEKQKERISPECKSVLENPIETNTANNNSFARISDKENLYNNIIPQTKLDDEIKSINEPILFNNINKVSLTSVKGTKLITDNIQNISDQDHKVDIENQKEHIPPECISVIEKPIEIDTAHNNSFTRMSDKEKMLNDFIPQTKLNDEDHKVDIENQKEHIPPESISVLEKPIDTAHNNSLTRIIDKENLQNNIIPQTKLEQDEVKSINESILCNNINKVSLTSVKEATLITDNIQNISDQDHKVDIEKQKEHISPESISVIEKPIDTADNNSFTRIKDKEKLYNYIIPQTKLEQDEVKSIQESILFNNINKVSLTSLKETTLITDNIQNISDQDHKVDIENQKEHISPECISVIEKSIEIDTTKNNYFTRMSDKEKLLSDIIPQTKLNDEVKSNQELNLFNNINKVSLTSVKEATLITDNIQNISDQDHKLDIVKQKEHVSPECKSVLEIPIETDTAHNNSLTKIIDKENLQNNFITQTKLDHEVKSINESILCNNIDKGSSTSLKKTTLITDNIQNISDKEIKNIIKSNTSRNNLNSKCDLSLNQNNSLSTNETTLATENFPIIDEQVIQNITIPKVNGDQTHSKSALSLNKSNLYPTKEKTLFPYHIQEIRDRAIQNISMSQSTTKSESLAYLHKNEDILPFTKNTTLDTSNLEIVEDQIIQNKRQTIDQIHLIPNKNNATPTKETYLDSNNVKGISDKVIQNIDTLKPNRRLTDFKSGLPDNQSDFIPTRESNLVYGNVQNNSDISINQSMSDQAIQSIPILQANRSQINSKSDLSLKQSKLTLTKDSNSQYFSDQTSQNINILRLNRDEINSKSDLLQNKEIFTPIKGTNFDKHNFQTISYQAIQNITTPQSNRNEIKSDLSPNESNVISSRKTTSVESNVQNIRDQVNKKIDLKSDLSVNESNLTSTSETTLEKSNIQNIADQSVQMITKSNGNKNQMYSSSKILLNKGNLSLLKSTTLLNNDIQNISYQAIQNIAQSQTNRNQIDSNKDSSIDETSLILTSLNKIEKLQRKTVGTKNISPKIKPKTSFNEENDKKISLKETSQNNLQGAIEVQFKNNVSATNEDNNNIKQSTHKTNIVKDIIYLDLKFQTCGVDKNKNVVRTLDTALFDNSYQLLGDNILHIKTLIRVDDNEIRIPIDADKDLSLKITKPKGKFSHKNRMNGNLSDPRNMLSSKQKSDEIGVFLNNQRINKTVNAKVSTKIKDSTKSAENLQDTLCSIYQEKLLPLHETLRNLIGDVDGLAEQQSIIIDKLHKENEIQANRIPNKNKACGCNSNYNIKVINSLN